LNHDPDLYLNREYSRLEFENRVLHEALDETNPLLERVRFLSIFTRNLDEFFMKRVGGLKQQMAAGVTDLTPDGRTPEEQWRGSLQRSREMLKRQTDCYADELRPALAEEGIHVVDHDELTTEEREEVRGYFENTVLPTLTPLTFDPAHPFPFISNLSLSLAILTRKDEDEPKFSRVKVPRNIPRLVEVNGKRNGDTYVPIEQVVSANADLLFPHVEVLDCSSFRVTRNAEVRRNEEVAEDLIEMIEEVLRERRFATVVRLEVEEGMPDDSLSVLKEQLELEDEEVFRLSSPLDFRDFSELVDSNRPDLKLDDWNPQPHPRLVSADSVFDAVRKKDVLLHHPYHSFGDTVQRFLDEAASDPDVLAIKLAIYRTAPDSKVIRSIIEAARNGKQVAVMVELKARFDEENNLRWVERLEEEGIHVAYGTLDYKTHTKTALVVRQESDGVRIYSHVATGNYHSETAEEYVDVGLLTADRDIGQDLVKVFNFFTGHSYHDEYRKILVAPGNMRDRLRELIRREARLAERDEEEGKEDEEGDESKNEARGRIVAKMNRLEDPEIISELYEASQAGVEMDLIVRDICRLRPGVEGLSENIRVHSIVGRFLEHSRIFKFANDSDPEYYIGSADWMTRNLDSRVEAVAPVEDPDLQDELDTVLEAALKDTANRWVMSSDGSYEKVDADGEEVDSQEVLMRRAEDAVHDS
jgi:polyphosphate kinase